MNGSHPDAKHHDVIDLETGKAIPRCNWANDETGEYETWAWSIGPDTPPTITRHRGRILIRDRRTVGTAPDLAAPAGEP